MNQIKIGGRNCIFPSLGINWKSVQIYSHLKVKIDKCYTAKNATDLWQVVNSSGLLQLVNKLQ